MANIKVAVEKPIADGFKLKFRTPCDSTVIEGLEVKYPAKSGIGTLNKKFVFKDAHGTELSGVGNLFVSGVMIEILLDVTHGVAYIQNADTNSYVESFKGEIKRLEDAQKQFLGVAGKAVEDCEQAAENCEQALAATQAATEAATAAAESVYQIAAEAAAAVAEEVATEFQNEIDKTNGRLDEMVVARALATSDPYVYEDDHFKVEITTNGAIACLWLKLTDIVADGVEVVRMLPSMFMPFDEQVDFERQFGDAVSVKIYPDQDGARTLISVVNEGEETINGTAYVTYDLASVMVHEIADIRVGYGDAKYGSAGEAVRAAQEMAANAQDLANSIDADVADHENRIQVLEKGGALDVYDTDEYGFAFSDEEGNVSVAISNVGELLYAGKGSAPIVYKQNGNYDAEINMFICYGQSWSTGYDASAITTEPRYDNLMLDTGIMNNPLDDLTAVATSFVPAVERTGTSSASSSAIVGETPVTAQMHTVKQLMESEDGLTVNDLSYQLLGTAPGMGNMSLAQLANGTDYYNRLISQVQQAHNIATAMGKRLVVQAFSWVQWGLGSGLSGTYAENLEKLRADIDTDVKAITGQKQDVKCITWQAYFYANSLNAKQVYDQFVGAAETYPNIICAGASYHLNRVTASNAHFDSESQDWLGAYFGVAYKRTIIDGEGFEPLKPTKASHSGKILYVKFNVPQRPLVFDTESLSEVTNKGFKLYATDGTEKTIKDVAIISPDTVKIVCENEDVLSTDRLTYSENTSSNTAEMRSTHGNLRDSQGDHIQYESGAGNNLPLHNWCVIFDKTIAELEG